MELFRLLRRNKSLLISKKTVVFIISRQKQIFTDFSDNTKIKTLKKYITNHLNNKHLDLLYNGHTVNNELCLNDLCHNNENIKRLFFQVIDNMEAKLVKEEELKIKNYKNEIIEMNNNNSNLNNELLKLKKENNEKKLEMQNATEKFNDINKIYEKQEEEIHELKKELSKINDDINEMNKINMDNNKYLIENKEFEIIGENKMKKDNSVVFLASVYTIEGKDNNNNNNISNNISNNKMRLSANNILKKQRNNSIDISTINTNNNLSMNNSENVMDTSNISASYATVPDKKKETKNTEIIKEEKKLSQTELIKKGYKSKYIEFNINLIDKDLCVKNNIHINNIKKWFTIFTYLDIKEQLLFSVTNKENGICVLYFWLYYLNNKMKLIDIKNESLIKEYSIINSSTSFNIPHFAKAAFKMLNNPIYSQHLEKPIDFFKDEKNHLISTYKLFYQLTKIFDGEDILNMEDNLFLNKMIENMKTRNGTGSPLGNYIQNLMLNQLDISFENVLKINDILKRYNIDKINTTDITKKDKTTGIIGIIVKDVLIFMGFFLDDKFKDEKSIQKYNILTEYRNNNNLKQEYSDNINKINILISNKYN